MSKSQNSRHFHCSLPGHEHPATGAANCRAPLSPHVKSIPFSLLNMKAAALILLFMLVFSSMTLPRPCSFIISS